MRRRRYHRNDYHRNEENNNTILLSEFKFYNKTKKVIDEAVIDDMEKQLLEEHKKQFFWSSDEFGKHGVGFIMSKILKHDKPTIDITILNTDKKFSGVDFCKCKKIMFDLLFLSFEPTDKQYEVLNSFNLTSYNYDNGYNIEFKLLENWNDTIKFLVENNLIHRFYSTDNFENYKNNIKELFNVELKKPKYNKTGNGYLSGDLYHIIDVIEKRFNNTNYRIALVSSISYYSTEYVIKLFKEDDKDYNYIDKGRLLICRNGKNYFIDLSTNIYESTTGQMLINIELYKMISENIYNAVGNNENIILPIVFRFYRDKAMKYELMAKGIATTTTDLIIEQYKKLLANNKKIKIGVVELDNNSIKVIGQNFNIRFGKDFISVKRSIKEIKTLINSENLYNFNVLYEKILQLSTLNIIRIFNTQLDEYKNFKRTNFIVNNIPIKVEKINNRININGTFCRIDDIFDILSKAICYNTKEEFNSYVKDVSFIGMEWKKIISNGLIMNLRNPFSSIFEKIGNKNENDTLMRFSLLWDAKRRQKIYLLINDNKYLITNKVKFKKHFNIPGRTVSMEQLINELSESIKGIDEKTVLDIVENAVKEAEIVRIRGEQLVKETIQEVKAMETEINIKGNVMYGYKLNGRISKSKYFIEKNDLSVFKFMNGSWNRRCVVDDHTKQRIFEDKLANRLVNIYNEPARIYTIH